VEQNKLNKIREFLQIEDELIKTHKTCTSQSIYIELNNTMKKVLFSAFYF